MTIDQANHMRDYLTKIVMGYRLEADKAQKQLKTCAQKHFATISERVEESNQQAEIFRRKLIMLDQAIEEAQHGVDSLQ